MFKFMDRIPPLVRVPLRFGLIGGALGFVLVTILYYIGRHPFLVIPIFDFRVALFGVFLYFILKELREDHFGGLLFFWQGTAAGGVFILTFGLLASLCIWVFGIFVPGFVTEYIQLATNQLKTIPKEAIEQIGKEVYEKNLELMPQTTALDLAILYFVQGLGIGLFVSIILSVILRRQPANT